LRPVSFLLAGANGAVFSSADGSNWVWHFSKADKSLRAGLFAVGRFLLVGNNEAILESGTFWPSLQEVGFSDWGFELLARGEGSRDYWLQASTDLANWKNLLAFHDLAEPMLLSDPEAFDLPKRFYRVLPPTCINPLPVSRSTYSGYGVSWRLWRMAWHPWLINGWSMGPSCPGRPTPHSR